RGPAVNLCVDGAVGLDDGVGGRAVLRLVVVMGDVVAGHLAGHLAHGVGTHAVGHHVDVPALAPGIGRLGADDRITILIIRAPHAGIGGSGVDDKVFPVHNPALCVCHR